MKTINVELNVDNKDAVKSVNQLEEELEQLREEFGKVEIGSREFEKLGNQIKKTEGQIKDIELQFESLDKEQRIVAVTDSFAGLAGTVEIAVGAFAALGIESEALEDVERRVIGLIGVVQGLQAVGEGLISANKLIGPSFRAAFTTATGAINITRVALASLGIGAVIAGVVALTQAFGSLTEATSLTNEELDEVAISAGDSIAEVETLTRAVNDQTLSEDARREALGKLQELYPAYFTDLGDDITNTGALEAAKVKLVDTLVREAKVRALQDKIADVYKEDLAEEIQLTGEINELRTAAASNQEKLNKKLKEGKITQSSYNTGLAQVNQQTLKAEGLEKKLQAIQTEREDQVSKLSDLINDNTDIIIKNGGATDRSTNSSKKNTDVVKENTEAKETNFDVTSKGLEQTTSAEEEYTENFIDLTNIRIKATEMEESKRQEIREQRRKERQAEFREDAEAFQSQVGNYADYAQGVADNIRQFQEQNAEIQQNLLKNQFDQGLITEEQYLKQSEKLNEEAFEKNKNVSIAEAIISTIQGGVDAFTSTLKIDPTGITGTILAGLALAAGYAQVNAIRSTTFESPNAGSSSIGSGGGAAALVGTPIGGGAPGGLFSDSFGTGGGSTTQGEGINKMYVLAGDVSSAQSANARIKQRRKL